MSGLWIIIYNNKESSFYSFTLRIGIGETSKLECIFLAQLIGL
jgi:hypothetical protein